MRILKLPDGTFAGVTRFAWDEMRLQYPESVSLYVSCRFGPTAADVYRNGFAIYARRLSPYQLLTIALSACGPEIAKSWISLAIGALPRFPRVAFYRHGKDEAQLVAELIAEELENGP